MELNEDSGPMRKLNRKYVEVEFEIAGQKINACLVPITFSDHIDCDAEALDAFKLQLQKTGKSVADQTDEERERALRAYTKAFSVTALYHAIRKSANGERFFQNPVSVMTDLSITEYNRLFKVYEDSFVLTEEERGNFYRGRAIISKIS